MPKSIHYVVTALVAYTNATQVELMESPEAGSQLDAGEELATPSLSPSLPEDGPDFNIIFPDGIDESEVAVDPSLYAESFAWPKSSTEGAT